MREDKELEDELLNLATEEEWRREEIEGDDDDDDDGNDDDDDDDDDDSDDDEAKSKAPLTRVCVWMCGCVGVWMDDDKRCKREGLVR